MDQELTAQETILITAAAITAELNEVHQIAKGMTLSVMNAKAISHRAGEVARGFKPITDYIEQIARDVAQFVILISKEASILSHHAVGYNRRVIILNRYEQVKQQAEKLEHATSLIPVLNMLSEKSEKDRALFSSSIDKLRLLLNDMKNSIRSSQVISTTSRVEAANGKEYRKNLEVVAEDLETSTENIREHIVSSHKKLEHVSELLQHEVLI